MKRNVGLWLVCLIFAAEALCFAESTALEQARRFVAAGKRDQAVKILRDLIKADPGNFDARVLLGSTLAIQGVRSESIQQIAEAVKIRPQSAEIYNIFGIVLSRFLETDDAKKAFEHAIQLDPRLAEAHVNLALLLAKTSDWEGAGEHLDSALALQMNTPASTYSHYLRAKIWAAQAQFEKADWELENAVGLRPNFAEAWSDLGWARRMLSDDRGALQAFDRAVLLNPNDGLAQYRLGTAYLRRGEPDRAVQHLRAALKLSGPDKPTLYNLELALRKAGHTKEAQEIGRQLGSQLQASRQSSENALRVTNLNTEGMRLEEHGDLHGAATKYRMALDLDPTAAGIRLNYGLSLCRLDQWQEGIAEIQEVLRLEPDNGAAAKALYIAKEHMPPGPTSAKRP